MSALRWGIVGSGNIAKAFAAALNQRSADRLYAVASRSGIETAVEEFSKAKHYLGYDALLADPQVQAVYIATPHPSHAQWAIRAVEAGKHVLCEKPLGLNFAEAEAVIDAARSSKTVLMEGFMYRVHQQTRMVLDLISSGAIGEVKLIRASFGTQKVYDPAARWFSNELGGGAILDLGCYGTSFARLIAGAASGKPFADPISVTGEGVFTTTGVDEKAFALLTFPNGIFAQLSMSITMIQDNVAQVFGTTGRIDISSPWLCTGRYGGKSKITVVNNAGQAKETVVETDEWLYGIEAIAFEQFVAKGEVTAPAPTAADTLGNMKALDMWRAAIGLTYNSEKPGGYTQPHSGHALVRARDASITSVKGVDVGKPLSAFAMGCAFLRKQSDMNTMLDAFFAEGGTVLDTAHTYAQGLIDKLLGHWVDSRGVRDQIVIVGKGGMDSARNFLCLPELIEPQLNESLERLKTNYLDVYFLHRDNPNVPVKEFVDALDRQFKAGRIRAVGGSNWALSRVAEANSYAARSKREPFKVVSNQFSLAEMLEPAWPGCVASSSAEDIRWFQTNPVTLFAWSSLARGFFSDQSAKERRDNTELVRCWYNAENFERKKRAQALAAKYRATLAQIALAYVLRQPFSIVPVIGPLTLGEFRDSLGALSIPIIESEVANLRNTASDATSLRPLRSVL